MSLPRASGWCLFLLAAAFHSGPAPAQTPTTAPTATDGESTLTTLQAQVEPLRAQLTTLREQLAATTDLEEEVRTRIEEELATADSSLSEAETALTSTADFQQRSSQVQVDSDDLRQQKEDLTALDPPVAPDDLTLSQLEQAAAKLQESLDQLKGEHGQPDDPQARAARRKVLGDLRESLAQNILTFSQPSAAVDGEPPLLVQSRQLATECKKLRAEASLLAVRAEMSLYREEDAWGVAQLRTNVLQQQISRTEAELKAYEQRIRLLRQEQASERVLEARSALAPREGSPPPQLVRSVIEGPLNVADEQLQGSLHLALEEVDIRGKRDRLVRDLEAAQLERDQVRTWFEQATKRVETTGPTQALGLRLRQQREQLPDLFQVQQRKTARLEEIESAQNSFLDYTEQLDAWSDLEPVIDRILASPDAPRSEDARTTLRAALQRAVEQRKTFLTELVEAYGDYTKTLDDLDVMESSLIEETREFISFMDERILWIRSHKPLGPGSFRNDKLTLLWILDGAGFPAVGRTIADDVREHYVLWSVLLLLFVALLIRTSPMRKKLRELARVAQGRVTTAMTPTLEAWLISMIVSIPWPALILLFAWRLRAAADSMEVTALATGLTHLGLSFFVLEFYRQVCRPNGLADAHFEWPDQAVTLLQRTFRGLILFALPAGALVVLLHAHESGAGVDTDAFEMLAFAATMLILLLLTHRLLKPSTGVLREWVAYQQDGWGRRLQYPVYFAGVGIFLLLMVLTVLGYYFTAQRLLEKTQITLWLILALVFIQAILFRTLKLHRRRLAMEQVRQRRAAAEEAAVTAEERTANVPDVTAETQTDLGSVSRQTQKLLNTTLLVLALAVMWGVWSDVLPALNYLDNDEEGFWPRVVTVSEKTETLDGTTYEEVEIRDSTTYLELAIAVLIATLTVTAAKNVPGLLEISVLQRLPLDASARYATTTITRYLIFLLGIVLVSNEIGIGWGQVQWLAAALTVGLGFGLQEIFANFVSGIIILFEQPVRVGDVVTIDSVSGVVSRIRMRSTTITDWDRKDYVVPNKEFITGRLLNWTLSDTTNRIVVNVGVAYGSDTNTVHEIISRVADEQQHVLKEPPPLVTFESFGDSSLNFVLRAYLASLDHRLQTISELHAAIHNELARAGIEIPFPQRDLHLKSLPADLDRVLPQPEPEYQHDG